MKSFKISVLVIMVLAFLLIVSGWRLIRAQSRITSVPANTQVICTDATWTQLPSGQPAVITPNGPITGSIHDIPGAQPIWDSNGEPFTDAVLVKNFSLPDNAQNISASAVFLADDGGEVLINNQVIGDYDAQVWPPPTSVQVSSLVPGTNTIRANVYNRPSWAWFEMCLTITYDITGSGKAFMPYVSNRAQQPTPTPTHIAGPSPTPTRTPSPTPPGATNLLIGNMPLPTGWHTDGEDTYWEGYLRIQDESSIDIIVYDCGDNSANNRLDIFQVYDPANNMVVNQSNCSGNPTFTVSTAGKPGLYRVFMKDNDTRNGNGGNIWVNKLRDQRIYRNPTSQTLAASNLLTDVMPLPGGWVTGGILTFWEGYINVQTENAITVNITNCGDDEGNNTLDAIQITDPTGLIVGSVSGCSSNSRSFPINTQGKPGWYRIYFLDKDTGANPGKEILQNGGSISVADLLDQHVYPVPSLNPQPSPSPTVTPTASPTPPPTTTPPPTGDMIKIPAGTFQMGCAELNPLESCVQHELPLHSVYLDEYYIDQTEVTNDEYRQCVATGQCNAPVSNASITRQSYYNNPTYGDYPVILINWFEAQEYCEWANKRLPTEAEWEKAARGPLDVRRFPWGQSDATCGHANIKDASGANCAGGDTDRVGLRGAGASSYGVLDMAGNVWEWTADWYQADYYTNSPANNPPGPASGTTKIMRGGSYGSGPGGVRVALRNGNLNHDILPTIRYWDVGIRCVADSDDPQPGEWESVGPNSASSGGISNNNGISQNVSVAAGPDNSFYVAWNDNSSGNFEIYVRRWNGITWTELAGSATGGGISNNAGESTWPSIAIDPNGNPWVAWHDDSGGDDEIYVKRWSGSGWLAVGSGSSSSGGISNNGGDSSFVDLAIATNGHAFAAWVDDSSGNDEIYVRHWNGGAWVELGSSASGGGLSNSNVRSGRPSVDLHAGLPSIAWSETGTIDDIYLQRWNGSAWTEVGSASATGGGISNTPGRSQYASLDHASAGKPYIAWYDDTAGQWEIYVATLDGNDWVAAGNSVNLGGGISSTSGISREPSLLVSASGTPIVAWQETVGSDNEIYIRRLSGNSWVEVGIGSAAGGGISNNTGQSNFPVLAYSPDGKLFVAWDDNSSGDYEIYVLMNANP